MGELERVLSRRALTRTLVRACVVGLLLIGVMPLVASVTNALLHGNLMVTLRYAGSRLDDELSILVACVLACITLLLLQGRIVRWLVPIPARECPECGYALRTTQAARCPECGLHLPPSLTTTPP
jgi:hypothetical protein